jgi:hypothetical protein
MVTLCALPQLDARTEGAALGDQNSPTLACHGWKRHGWNCGEAPALGKIKS